MKRERFNALDPLSQLGDRSIQSDLLRLLQGPLRGEGLGRCTANQEYG
jgi:hypothetical protein